MSIRDPGPPTWAEALAGHQVERAKAGDWVRRLTESTARMAAGDAASREAAMALKTKYEAEWKHWNGYHAKAAAFLKVHPEMAGTNIYMECPHMNRCFAGADAGWYLGPGAKAEAATSFYEREPGDGTEEERTP